MAAPGPGHSQVAAPTQSELMCFEQYLQGAGGHEGHLGEVNGDVACVLQLREQPSA
jgi:hypothetical protein